MVDLSEAKVEAFKAFAKVRNWTLLKGNSIVGGQQLSVYNGISTVYVNFYHTGIIRVEGKACMLKTSLEKLTVLMNGSEDTHLEESAEEWIRKHINSQVVDFLYANDRKTLLAAAETWLAVKRLQLPDYSVVVMPFAKVYEGFVIRLAIHLNLTTEDAVRESATEIEVGKWIGRIKLETPDPKRNKEVGLELETAWQYRNKAVHSDFGSSSSTISSINDAEKEIDSIIGAMKLAHRFFVQEEAKLVPTPDKS